LRQDTISNLLRAKQYIIPNYPLPPNEDKIEILRVVVRESISFDLLDRLITDICATTQDLIDNDQADLAILGKSKDTSTEKEHSSSGAHADGSTQVQWNFAQPNSTESKAVIFQLPKAEPSSGGYQEVFPDNKPTWKF